MERCRDVSRLEVLKIVLVLLFIIDLGLGSFLIVLVVLWNVPKNTLRNIMNLRIILFPEMVVINSRYICFSPIRFYFLIIILEWLKMSFYHKVFKKKGVYEAYAGGQIYHCMV